jgi:MFS family permease
VRPGVVPDGPILALAYGAVRNVLGDPVVRRIFLIFGVSFLANQMARPYLPVVVEELVGTGPGLASAIGLVMGTAALVGGLVGPFTGAAGDRIGFRTVLAAGLAGGSIVLVAMPWAPAVGVLALLAAGLSAATATVSAMVFGLLATEVAPERRSQTLNLVYLPLYAAGIIGPSLAAIVVATFGLDAPFFLGAIVFAVGAVTVARRRAPARSVVPA